MMNATREKTRLWLLILVGVVATLLGQTHAREIFAPSPHESGIFAAQTPASTGEIYDGIQYDAPDSSLAAKTIGNSGPNGFVLVGEGSLHSTVAVRNGSLVNRVFDSGFASNPSAAQPLGRYFAEGGAIPSSAGQAITSRGLNLPGIVNDARMGAAYRANSNIPALRGPAAGGTTPELIIDPSNFRHLQLQGGYVPVGP